MTSIYIPHKFPSLNEYISAMNRNKFVGNKMKQEFTNIAKLYCTNLSLNDICPILVRFEWHEASKRRDLDNVAFAKKFILDGMVQASVIPNDTQQWVKGFTDTFIYGKEFGVKITIERVED